jgi:hypothetical protein
VRSLGVRSCRLPRFALRGCKTAASSGRLQVAADNNATMISLFLPPCQDATKTDASYVRADTGPAGPLESPSVATPN